MGAIIEVSGLAKRFGDLAAVDDVSFAIGQGEVFGLLGLWPIEVVAPFMQAVAKATPTGWAVAGLTDIVVRNQGFSAAVLPAAVLLGFAALTLGLGVRFLKFE